MLVVSYTIIYFMFDKVSKISLKIYIIIHMILMLVVAHIIVYLMFAIYSYFFSNCFKI